VPTSRRKSISSSDILSRTVMIRMCPGRRCRYRRFRRREHPALVAQARPRALSRRHLPDDHRRLRRQQRAAGQAMEA
jgi:hypothetical protein